MRIVFMGTPEFAVPSLIALTTLPDASVVGVVTRVDKPVGRARTAEFPPIKVAAIERGLHVVQPGSFRRPEAVKQIQELEPDIIIVAAFGQILPQSILSLPKYGCLNVHASLLPRYRGASPISTAILNGESETGNTIMLMDVGLDTGDILTQGVLSIDSKDTTATLTSKLAQQGAELLLQTLPRWIAGEITPRPQNENESTMTHILRKDNGKIDWNQSAVVIDRQIRAYTPWPGTMTVWQGQPLKIIGAHVGLSEEITATDGEPGQVISMGHGKDLHLGVICGGKSWLILDMIQLPGKRALFAPDVARGQPTLAKAKFPS
jgi:methionyl-tRNA formyltransferase